MLSIGVTINMDGSAIFLGTSIITIMNFENVLLNSAKVISIMVVSSFASLGVSAVPGSSLIVMVAILKSFGLNTDWIGVLVTVDWLAQRFVCMVNVMGDAIGCAVIEKLYLNEAEENTNLV